MNTTSEPREHSPAPDDEERGPGRPGIGGAVHVRLGEQLAQADRWAAFYGVTRADAIRAMTAFAADVTAGRRISVNDILGDEDEHILGGLPDDATGVWWEDTEWTECRDHLLSWSWAEAAPRSDAKTGIILTGPVGCNACAEERRARDREADEDT
jgi:hypothetical protein